MRWPDELSLPLAVLFATLGSVMGHATTYNPLSDIPEDSQGHFGALLLTVQLCGGGFLWLCGACIPQDYKTIKGRRVSWAILTMYLLCRYVTAISAVLEMIYVCMYPRSCSASVGKAAIGLRRFSMLSGFGIMLLRVNSLWNHTVVSVLTSTSLLAFLGVIAFQISDLDVVYIGHTQTPFVSVLLYTSTLIFILGVLGMTNVRKPRDPTSPQDSQPQHPPRRYAVADTVMDTWKLAVFWLCSVVASTLYFAFQHMDGFLRRAIGFVGCLVAVHTACREYEKLAEDRITISIPPLTWDWRIVLRRVRHIRLLDVITFGIGDTGGPTRITRRRSQHIACTDTRGEVFELKALPSDALTHDKSSAEGLKSARSAQQAPSDEGSSSAFSSPVSALPSGVHFSVSNSNPSRTGADID
ncbi:hypothetical protein C8Q79DRAFT_1011175 [Trametes meyenii]|nr:hypothetical protein C8Q79DRAFT_1011175 [Trametes meyenii]